MNSALSIRGEDWWPFSEETVTDLLKFLEDRDGDVELVRVMEPVVVANDNWPLHMECASLSELPPLVVWNPRFRTAD